MSDQTSMVIQKTLSIRSRSESTERPWTLYFKVVHSDQRGAVTKGTCYISHISTDST